MKHRILAIRYFLGSCALTMALALVAFAQQAAPQQTQPQAQAPPKDYPAARIEGLVREWTRARDYTKEYLDAMPDDGYAFRPTPEIRSFAEQMLHLTAANFNFAARVFGATNPYQGKNLEKLDELKSKAACTKIVLESYDFVLNGLKNTTEAKLDEKVAFIGYNRTKVHILGLAFEHGTHHRGQTTIYLRLKGVTPPAEKLG
jgi:uncharacterized damage-inducible protein DinB